MIFKYSIESNIFFFSRDSITVGRLFILRMLEEMYMAGYEPCVNSCLSR